MDTVTILRGRAEDWLREIAVSAAFSTWLALMGPFGLYRLGPPEVRIAFALSLSLFFALIYGLAGRAGVYLGPRFGLSPWIGAPLAYGLATVPMSLLVAGFSPIFFPHIRHWPPVSDTYLRLLLIQLPVIFAYLAVTHVLERRAKRPSEPAPSAPPACRLAARLPAHLAGEIVALEAEDHYVRVHTTAGSTLLHGRMSDAIAQLDGLPGLRVHRSWWVATGAIRIVIATGRRTTLKLSNGAEAPVARDAAAQVRQAVAA